MSGYCGCGVVDVTRLVHRTVPDQTRGDFGCGVVDVMRLCDYMRGTRRLYYATRGATSSGEFSLLLYQSPGCRYGVKTRPGVIVLPH